MGIAQGILAKCAELYERRRFDADIERLWRAELTGVLCRIMAHRELFELTDAENRVLKLTADVWNAYTRLPVQHPHDADEFMRAIHAAQNIVLARLAGRHQGEGK